MSTILVADDNAWVRRVLTATLQLDHHEVVIAADGQEALERLKSAPVDLLILDLGMPRVSGLGVLDRVREEFPHLAVLVLTGLAGPADAPDLVRRGAREVLAKPVNTQALRAAVERILTSQPPSPEAG